MIFKIYEYENILNEYGIEEKYKHDLWKDKFYIKRVFLGSSFPPDEHYEYWEEIC
jgi:hypothetical protein